MHPATPVTDPLAPSGVSPEHGRVSGPMPWSHGHAWQKLMLFFCVYVAAVLGEEWLCFFPTGSVLVSFSAGILMAALYLGRAGYWPPILLLAFAGKVFAAFVYDVTPGLMVRELAWDFVLALVGASAARAGIGLWPVRTEFWRFLLVCLSGAIFGPLASLGGSVLFELVTDLQGFHGAGGVGYLSGTLGALCILSLLLSLAEAGQAEWRSRFSQRRLEFFLGLLIVPLSTWLAFYRGGGGGVASGLLFLLPVLIFSLRFGPVGASIGCGVFLLSISVCVSGGMGGIQDESSIMALQSVCILVIGASHYSAFFLDVQRQAARRLLGLHDSTTELVVSCEIVRDEEGAACDIRFLDVNPAFTLITGYSREVALGNCSAKLYGLERPPHLAEFDQMMRSGKPITFDTYLPKARRHLKATAFPTDRRNGFTIVATDVTLHLEREVESNRVNRMYAVLIQINQVIVRSHEIDTLLKGVCRAFVEQGGAGFCCAVWRGTVGAKASTIAHSGNADDSMLVLEGVDGVRGEGLLGEMAMREARAVVCNDFVSDSSAKAWAEVAARNGFRSAAAFPVRFSGVVCGALCIFSKELKAFSTKELTLLTTASVDISHALDNQHKEAARLQAVSELQESEHRFRMLFEQAPVAYLSIDAQGSIGDMNPAWLTLTGLGRTDCLGRQLLDFLQPEARRLFLEGFGQLTARGGERVFELQLQNVPQRGVTVVMTIRAEPGAAGEFRIAHCVVFNITERKRYEDAVRVSEQRLTWAFEVANDGIWELCPERAEHYFSQRFCGLLGHDQRGTSMDLATWRSKVHSEDRTIFDASFGSFLKGQETEFQFEHRVECGSRGWVWLLCRGRVIERSEGGGPARVIGTISDISERKRAEDSIRETALKYRSYIDESPLAVLILDETGSTLEMNGAARQLFGLGKTEVGGAFVDTFVDPPSMEAGKSFLASLLKQGRADCEIKARRRNGSVVQLAIQASKIPSNRLLLFCQDVTAKRRTEHALQARESMLESILHTALDGFWIMDSKGMILEVNEAYCSFSGYSHKELLQLGILDLDAVEGPTQIQRHLDRISRQGNDRWETAHKRRDGVTFDVEISATFLPVEDGRIVAFLQNITNRKRAENGLRQSERRLSLIIEGSGLAAWDWDMRTGEVFFNKHWSLILGRGESEVSMNTETLTELIHPDDRKRVSDAMAAHVRGETPYFDCEYRMMRKDGTWMWVMDRGQVISKDSSGRPMRATGTQRDVTSRKLAEDRVRQQAALLDQTQDIVLAVDRSGLVLYCNSTAAAFVGGSSSEIEGRRLWELLPDTDPVVDENMFSSALNRGEWLGELRFMDAKHQGQIWDCRWTLVAGEKDIPCLMLVVATDVSEKKMLEARFLRAQRMESIGALATGVAHDLNNIFLPITLAANMLRQNPGPEQQAILHAMLDQSAQRGADIVKQLLTFGKGLDGRRVELQPRMLMHEIRRIISETFPRNISLDCKVPEDLWTIQADPTQIHQVLLNLCVNARDAMPEGGVLSLSAENVFFDEYYAAMNPDAEAGPYIVLQVSDSGIGIPLENQEKIFDPFFTTKAVGQGTGLGLSTVHGIVKSHRGFIQVRSNPGQGAVFKVYIPAIPNVVEVGEEAPEMELPDGKGQCLLVVDDEDAVRESIKHLLETHGYRVVSAVDGREGMVCFVQRKDEIRALITDIMMPVMDGVELIRAVRRINSTLPIVAMSGLPEKEALTQVPGVTVDDFLLKPFVSDQLLVSLHSVLAAREKAVSSAVDSNRPLTVTP